MEKRIAACGNDCLSCPRYSAAPFEKAEEDLRYTARLWQKIGYRDTIVSAEEIRCAGCSPQNPCRYHVAACCAQRSIPACGVCGSYPCETIRAYFSVTESFEPGCREVCTAGEYEKIRRAFFEKKQNLDEMLDENS
jgi:hypothetical protein